MAFTFPSFVAVSDPVTPSQAASKAFQASYNAVNVPNLSQIQQKVIAIVALIDVVTNTGDTHNYSAAHKQLIADATAFAGPQLLPNFNLLSALDTLYYAAGHAVGGTTSDITTLLNTGKDFAALPEQVLDAIIALLIYRSYI